MTFRQKAGIGVAIAVAIAAMSLGALAVSPTPAAPAGQADAGNAAVSTSPKVTTSNLSVASQDPWRPATSTVGVAAVQSAPVSTPPPSAQPPVAAPLPLPREPAELVGFWQGDDAERYRLLQVVSGLTPLPPSVITFLAQVLSHREVGATTRNHCATLLGSQPVLPDGYLIQLQMAAMNQQEDPLWRDYAVQHAALAVRRLPDPAPVAEWLWTVVQGGQGLQRGTALLQLSRLLNNFRLNPPDSFSPAIIAMAQNHQEGVEPRIAALAVIGEQRLREHLPAVKAIAQGDEGPAITTAAIACAGLIGQIADATWLQVFTRHDHPLIRSAAEGALKRLANPHQGAQGLEK